ncbi:MAG: hypothetical protein KKE62_19780 [Proteobacteria bacterium]|nr:hypothetical protein [Pseudomonadota bacterium]MBU1387591.1 hypothetical protein [Pseudomonadota bacterium]MBU1545081.1 hypothetical protein [Pseudomonadota bacterium]
MQDNSVVIKDLGILAEEVYKNSYSPGQNIQNGSLYTDYKVIKIDNQSSSGFQGMLLEELDANGGGTGQYVFAFRGTETKSGEVELLKDLIITDILSMGSGTAPPADEGCHGFC